MKEVYTLEDLTSRDVLDKGADKPARLAVIGHPIAHSASPRMHQAALDAMGIDVRYIRIDVEPGQVAEAFARMRGLGFVGCNVTVPHKFEAMQHCAVSPGAQALGAVNTLCFGGEDPCGYNTDGPGFTNAIQHDFGVPLASLKVVILGAGGGAGQAIATQCVMLGVPKLVMVNRSLDKLGPLLDRMKSINSTSEVVALSFDDSALAEHCHDAELLVNTSSVGLKIGDPSIIPISCLKPPHFVYDTIYQPAITPLLAMANLVGCRTSNGMSMLLHQGVLAFQYWFPQTQPLIPMGKALGYSAGA